MIISHKYGYVFVKSHKTAGTSVEVALNANLGTNDVASKMNPPEEGHEAKNHLGFNPYLIPETFGDCLSWKAPFKYLVKGHKAHQHMMGETILKTFPATRDYKWFSIERNPWEKTLSAHRFLIKNKQLSKKVGFEEYVLEHRLPSDFDLYNVSGVDMTILEYSNLEADLENFLRSINHPTVTLPYAKKMGAASNAEHVYTAPMSDRIKIVFHREITKFGYVEPVLIEA